MVFNLNLKIVFITIICLLFFVVPVSAVTWTAAGTCWTATDGSFNYVMFNSTGSGTYTFSTTGEINVLVVAGGGSGSAGIAGNNRGGGGGGGEVINGSVLATIGESIHWTVGTGGAETNNNAGNDGTNSSFGSIQANRGKGAPSATGGASGSGNAAGVSDLSNGSGGGGDLTVGGDSNGVTGAGGNGGNATQYVIGTTTFYFGWGGGGSGNDGGAGGSGSFDGGGHGSKTDVPKYDSKPGTNNTGNGGGGGYAGSSQTGKAGGSGVIILKYEIPKIIASFSSTNISVATNTTSRGWEGLAPFTMQFTNTSTNPPHTSWVWNYTKLGNVSEVTFNSSAFYNPIYTFENGGNYSISLKVTGTYGTNISTQKTWINVSSPVAWTSNKTIGIVGLSTIQFTDMTPIDGGTYNWSFGDGNYSAMRNVSYTYVNTGLYTVRLTSPYPGIEYLERTNYINISAPSFVCSPLYGLPPLSVNCNDTSAILSDDVLWDMGDGYTSHTTGNITYTYTTNGSYSVTLKSPYNGGINTTLSGYINVGTLIPGADFTSNVTEVAAGGYVAFTDTSSNSPTSWIWSFDGGTGIDSTLQNPVWQFNTVGNFSVNLTASNIANSDSEIKTNYIRVYPHGWYPGMLPITAADFVATPYTYANVNKDINFTGTVTTGTPQWYIWDWGDSSPKTYNTSMPMHNYTTAGTYTVNFTAWNAISSYPVVKTGYITIYGPGVPYAQFFARQTSGTPGVLINFVDQSLKGTTSGLVYNWSFGDGVYSTTPYSSIQGDVQHVYTYAGVYDVNLSITNANGTSYQFRSQYITVAVNQQTQTTFYTPKTIQFHVTDIYGNSISGATVDANFNQTTLPSGWLVSNFGMNTEAANQALNGTLIMSGTTSNTGDVVYTMNSAIGYDITISYGGHTNYYFIYPASVLYNLKFITAPTVNSTTTDLFSGGKTGTWFTTPDVNNVTLWWSFQDISGLTTRVDYYVVDFTTNATVYNYTLNSPGTSQYMLNYTEPNIRGTQRIWYMNITRSV